MNTLNFTKNLRPDRINFGSPGLMPGSHREIMGVEKN